MKCKIQWIDKDGKPTPDDNEAIGLAVCYSLDVDGGLTTDGKAYPICEAHAYRLKHRHVSWPATKMQVTTIWKLIRFNEG